MGEGQPDASQPPTRRRATVQEAAEALGVTVEAIRGRIKRGKLAAEREKDGSVYVWLEADQTATGYDQSTTGPQPAPDQSALIESLLEQVTYMREQLAEEREARRRADTIMAQLSQANAEQARTIRALEAPRDEPGAPETTERVEDRTDAGEAQTATERRSWWRRFFGFE